MTFNFGHKCTTNDKCGKLVFCLLTLSPGLYASLITLCCYFTCVVYPSQCFVYSSYMYS